MRAHKSLLAIEDDTRELRKEMIAQWILRVNQSTRTLKTQFTIK